MKEQEKLAMLKRIAGSIAGLMLTLLIGIGIGGVGSKAATWDVTKTYTTTNGGFEFSSYLSTDKKESWIYLVKPKVEGASPKSLNFPEQIENVPLTRIGWDDTNDPEEQAEFPKNIFNQVVESAHSVDGNSTESAGIKTMTIPDTVIIINSGTFAGMSALTKVDIPDSVTELKPLTFYGCKNLKEVKLPKNMLSYQNSIFYNCKKITKITLSSENSKFKVKNNMLMSKDGKILYWIASGKKKATVPNSVTTIESVGSSCVGTIVLGKNVTDLKYGSLRSVADITISKKNPLYAKDGQCIYRKKDKALLIGIVKDNKLVISEKVKKTVKVTYTCGQKLKILDIPASVTYMSAESYTNDWSSHFMYAVRKVYFRGKTPPHTGSEKVGIGASSKVYVPKGSLKRYKNWYKRHKSADTGNRLLKSHWYTF